MDADHRGYALIAIRRVIRSSLSFCSGFTKRHFHELVARGRRRPVQDATASGSGGVGTGRWLGFLPTTFI